MITSDKVLRFKNKVEAFQTAQTLDPTSAREKVSGFVLLVGSGPQVVPAGEDRDLAVEKAESILGETDTVVVVSKLQARVGEISIVKNQLVLTRKYV